MKTKISAYSLLKALGITEKKIMYTLKIQSESEKKSYKKTSSCLKEISDNLSEKEGNLLRLKTNLWLN